ncbi:DoxX family protein [Devosia sp. ZB163]|uniref:DoxX family protein n=1 Tax=Devosia sp. ZB163 TaxID=3025938 RepID=UPI002362F827|nr:DoxX family protein [Devosia sp. ZB163]MDC9823658.1 DoxX family protein [Devosia sp. ZB163]
MDFLTSLDFWLWAAQVAAGAMYLMAGVMKSTQPIPKLAGMMKWPGDVQPGFVRFIGGVDSAAGLGLILPMATGILTFLTPLAALGSVVLQIIAIGYHGKRGETGQTLGANLLLLALSAFVLWGRRGLLGL